MMSGAAPDCSAVRTRCGRPLEVVISSLMVMSGLAFWKSAASFSALAWPQLGVHHTTSPAIASDGARISTETALPSSNDFAFTFMSFSLGTALRPRF